VGFQTYSGASTKISFRACGYFIAHFDIFMNLTQCLDVFSKEVAKECESARPL
jgi:hypothetical protein